MVRLGIDRIGEFASLFKGKKIGLITNYSGVNSALIDDMTAFKEAGYNVVRLFTPEHGLYGAMDGAAVGNSTHPVYGTEIVSLYGDRKKPQPEDLKGIDLLVYDIQDVGLRYYTYIYTLAYCMQAAAENKIAFLVLDRPDPLGGMVAGNRMDPKYDCFVGAHRLALRYGLTAAEVGYYFKQYFKLDMEYMVLPMQGYRKDMKWPETGQLWNLPSPSIHTFNSILCYVGGCFFEATNVSEGRGTAEPFQIYGAPYMDMDKLVRELRSRIQDDNLAMRARAFTPFWSKHQGQTCFGVEFIPLNSDLDFLKPSLITMKTMLDMYPNDFEFRSYADVSRLTSLSGDQTADKYLKGEWTIDELMNCWKQQAVEFEKETEVCRIYG